MVMELVYDAMLLMLIGMGSVFAFLFILVLAVQWMSRLLPKPAITPTSEPAAIAATAVPPGVIAAISAAIHQFRQQPASGKSDADNTPHH
jgi:oxaloacetate decarboxylase gamma subunit